MVAEIHLLESPGNGIQPTGFGSQILVCGIRAAHDERQAVQGRGCALQVILGHERIEATQGSLVA